MWLIAARTLIADKGKLLTAVAGVVFSIVLVNVQGGLFLGLIRKAALLIDIGEADIWVGHRHMHTVDFPRIIPRRWISRVRSTPGVERAEPYIVGYAEMTLPSGAYETVVVVGVDSASLLGNPLQQLSQGNPAAMLETGGYLTDEGDDVKLESPYLGELREIGGYRAKLVGKTRGIMGFLVSPYVFTTFDRATQWCRIKPGYCSYYLVKLESVADADLVCQELRRRIPELDVYTREEYGAISVNYWLTRTGLGISFGAATLIGLVVGLVMVVQALYALVLDRLGDFGTLKAIGAGEDQIYAMLFFQAATLASIGSVIGLLIVTLFQHQFSTPKAPIVVPVWLSWLSCGLVGLISAVASILPYLRIRKVDPTTVLQS